MIIIILLLIIVALIVGAILLGGIGGLIAVLSNKPSENGVRNSWRKGWQEGREKAAVMRAEAEVKRAAAREEKRKK